MLRGTADKTFEFEIELLYTSWGREPRSFDLGFDAINSERASGNLSRLLSQPVYRDAVVVLLVPMVRSLSPLLIGQVEKMLPTPLPFGQSLLLVWPHLTSLVALSTYFFTFSHSLCLLVINSKVPFSAVE